MDNTTNPNASPLPHVKIVHTFNAPRQLVFSAWTDPAQLLQWYAPDGCTITFKSIAVRENGSYHSCIYNEQFGNCWCKGTYITVQPPEKLVFTMEVTDETGNDVTPEAAGMAPGWPQQTTVTVLFTDNGDNTTTIQLYQTVSEELAKKTGAYPSWLNMFERLQKSL